MRKIMKIQVNVWPGYRLVPSGYLCVLGVREDWGKGRRENSDAIFPSSLPMKPGARLNRTPNLLSPPKHINSHWVRVWPRWITASEISIILQIIGKYCLKNE